MTETCGAEPTTVVRGSQYHLFCPLYGCGLPWGERQNTQDSFIHIQISDPALFCCHSPFDIAQRITAWQDCVRPWAGRNGHQLDCGTLGVAGRSLGRPKWSVGIIDRKNDASSSGKTTSQAAGVGCHHMFFIPGALTCECYESV